MKIKTIIAGAAAALVLAGCGATPAGPGDATPANLGGESVEMDDKFVHEMRENTSVTGSDDEIIALGYQICSEFAAGGTLDSISTRYMAEGSAPYDIGFAIGASVSAYCPQYQDELGYDSGFSESAFDDSNIDFSNVCTQFDSGDSYELILQRIVADTDPSLADPIAEDLDYVIEADCPEYSYMGGGNG